MDLLRCENFSLSEFVRGGDAPVDDHLRNLIALANRLQVVRDTLHKPITITSGFRTTEHNKKIGGAVGSLHLHGMAADIQIKDIEPIKVYERLYTSWSGGLGLYDQHVHVDVGEYRRWNNQKRDD
ncbi:MAG: DUF882 domain-containing protein [Nitrosomonas sp.]|nr:DUF882 domain-containing protein [Nitrosomonas sp.]